MFPNIYFYLFAQRRFELQVVHTNLVEVLTLCEVIFMKGACRVEQCFYTKKYLINSILKNLQSIANNVYVNITLFDMDFHNQTSSRV